MCRFRSKNKKMSFHVYLTTPFSFEIGLKDIYKKENSKVVMFCFSVFLSVTLGAN